MLYIKEIMVWVEEDSWEEGCILGTVKEYNINDAFHADTKQDLINNLIGYFEVPLDHITLNSCEEMGRIDVCRHENSQGMLPSEEETQAWKRGEITLLYVTYTMFVFEQTPFDLLGE